eukprot:7903795-Pyramimonas_sp.AAC.1
MRLKVSQFEPLLRSTVGSWEAGSFAGACAVAMCARPHAAGSVSVKALVTLLGPSNKLMFAAASRERVVYVQPEG